ncbi:glycosyltransferase family 2 protein [Pseudoalteromonas sp. G4]|uniref:glycosyltransferase family 2 protein n=1 Tax=Pseudoalteromonas sp. G4 TaxID=2992761 RepID=UPI00237D467B|nr:glycosyltransferase [Pseudoalteromonas sp. G4]MDE3270650.1 glycosyltransferase [Pseudoalteromonas sp. G4]
MDIETVLLVLVLIPGIFLLVELIQGLFVNLSTKDVDNCALTERDCVLSIIMPAHNEELIISKTVSSIHKLMSAKDRLIVVADNCQDATANIVRTLNLKNVIVLERKNAKDIGKGFALDYGFKYLKENKLSFDLLGVVDSDCEFTSKNAIKIIKTVAEREKLFQVGYLMKATDNKSALSAFAWYVKTACRSIGMDRLFGACHIQGSGFFIDSSLSEEINFASGSIVEDLELGLNLAEQNIFCKYIPNVTLISEMPSNIEVLKTQKSRWEVGHLNVVLSETFPRMYRAIKNINLRYFLLVCDLSIPPLITYLLCVALFGLVNLFFGYKNSLIILAYLSSISFIIYLHWRRFSKLQNIYVKFSAIYNFVEIKFRVIASYCDKKAKKWNKTKR